MLVFLQSVTQSVSKENREPGRKRKSGSVAKPKDSVSPREEVYASPETFQVEEKSLKALAPVQPKPRGRPKKSGGASQTKKKAIAKKQKKTTTTKPRKKEPLPLEDEVSLSAESEHTVSLQATPEVTFPKKSKKQKTSKFSIAKELEDAYDMADITPDKLSHLHAHAPSSKQTFGGLSRTIVEQFGRNTSESSVLKDLLEQYNEIKTKYHELKVSHSSTPLSLSLYP